jgi:hypothetical protein
VRTTRHSFANLIAKLPLSTAALEFAEQRHAGQLRADGSPFIEHPLEVARLLRENGAADHVIAAGLLHDTVEKTATDGAELHRRFGPRVAALVLAVSEDRGIRAYAARKADLRERAAAAGAEALTVFAADKLSKAREYRRLLRRAGWPRGGGPAKERRKLVHYRDCAELLGERLGDSPLVLAFRAELAKLPAPAAAPPASRANGPAPARRAVPAPITSR